jgi:glycoprotein-N-acetylgalactosamine 3-beta-galactosyltransferase
MDNMRHLLSSFDPLAALHLGFRYEDPNNGQHFMSGGSGYVLTREAIRRFVEIGLAGNNNSIKLKGNQTNSTLISPCSIGHQGLEDVNLGIIIRTMFNTVV